MVHEHLAETAGMTGGQADVLVEMKSLNFCPIDARSLRQRILELELRCPRRSYDPSRTALRKRTSDRRRSLVGGRADQRDFVFKYSEEHWQHLPMRRRRQG